MPNRAPEHKELTMSLLRSFHETARLGAMSAAASALGLSQPTVWKQIRALEQHFGAPLVAPHKRGCRLTPAGDVLVRLSSPLMNEFDVLRQRFREQVDQRFRRLSVAASPRPCEEELMPCIADFEKRYPGVRISLQQSLTPKGLIESVRSGSAILGISGRLPAHLRKELRAQPLYQLEFVLLVPRNHPLASGKLRLEHFAKYPLLNSRKSCINKRVEAALESVGAFDHPERTMEIHFHRTIRWYVECGFGIGIVPRAIGMKSKGQTIERPLEDLFRCRITINAVYRRHVTPDVDAEHFIEVIKERLRL